MNIDNEILRYLNQHNDKGIELIINCYGGLLKSVIHKHLYSLQAYQGECMNDTLLAIWNNWEKFDPEKSSFKNWICAIARYRAINYLKKYALELEHIEFDKISSFIKSKEEFPLQQELWAIELKDLLAPLSPRDQQIFTELFYEEQSIDEVAQKHNLSKDNLYQRVSRGRKKIRRGKTK